MTLSTAASTLKVAASQAIDTVAATPANAAATKTTLLATIDSEIGAAATSIVGFFEKDETKAAAWESRHLKLLNLIALAGWLFFAGALFLRLHG